MAVLESLLIAVLILQGLYALPEQGVFTKTFTNTDELIYPFAVHKSMFNGSVVDLKLECGEPQIHQFTVTWLIRKTECAEEYIEVEYAKDRLDLYYRQPAIDMFSFGYKTVSFLKSPPVVLDCSHVAHLDDLTNMVWTTEDAVRLNTQTNGTAASQQDKDDTKPNTDDVKSRKKRDDGSQSTTTTPRDVDSTTKAAKRDKKYQIVKTRDDGIFLFLLKIDVVDTAPVDININVTISMKGTYGYLSAQDWPLLPFYGVMCGIYVIYGLVWLVLLFCNWKDLLRIQFWIGGVIFLGMLEKAVFFAEYESVNTEGQSVRGAVIFAELVSCMKRTLARMLVVIVSLGFGIVKPRLGPMLHRVLGMGALYMILGSVEGILRVTKHKSDTSKQLLLASIPLAVLDAAICWWVFTSLVQTTRTLRLRRNLVKLSLYRHFTNTLIFAVLASVAFMIWSIKQHKMVTCLTDWKELWVDDAFWHLLFSVILMVIMVLWRPTANNQRYAFSPLLDAADDEAEEPMISDAFDGMKMRGTGKSSTSPHQRGDSKSKADEDLKWIEENIPTSVTDTALPSLLDSDEEIMTTKFEMSKME